MLEVVPEVFLLQGPEHHGVLLHWVQLRVRGHPLQRDPGKLIEGREEEKEMIFYLRCFSVQNRQQSVKRIPHRNLLFFRIMAHLRGIGQ